MTLNVLFCFNLIWFLTFHLISITPNTFISQDVSSPCNIILFIRNSYLNREQKARLAFVGATCLLTNFWEEYFNATQSISLTIKATMYSLLFLLVTISSHGCSRSINRIFLPYPCLSRAKCYGAQFFFCKMAPKRRLAATKWTSYESVNDFHWQLIDAW